MKSKRQSPLKLSQLEILIAVAHYNNFSEAALHLEMSQSAVSNAIARLEAELGVVLLSRGRHGAQVTPVGARIVAHARQMMKLQAEIIKEAHLTRSLNGGEVRITSFRSVSTHILPMVMSQFHQRFPEVSVKITEYLDDVSIEQDLQNGLTDIGFIERPLDDTFEAWDIFHDEYIVLCPQAFEPAGETLTWDDLAAYPLIMADAGDTCDAMIYAHCATHGKTLHATYEVKADSTIVSMVAQGLGMTIIPRLAAEPIPTGVKVFSLPVPLFRTIRVAVLAKALHSPPVFAFLELLKDSGRRR